MRRVHIDGKPVAWQQLRVVQRQNPFHNHNARRHNRLRDARHARVRLEVVDRPLDRFALGQRPHMLHNQLALQRVGMVEVALRSRVQRELR